MCGQRVGGWGDFFRWAGGWRKADVDGMQPQRTGDGRGCRSRLSCTYQASSSFYKWGLVLGF